MRFLTFVLASALVMPAAAPAQEFQAGSGELQTPGAKLLVTQCNPHVHTLAEAHPWVDPYGNWHYDATTFPVSDAFLAVAYKNQADKNATEIDFGLAIGGSLVAVAKDLGNFAPGVEVDHEFAIAREIFPLGPGKPYCSVLRVKYADGSVWQNPTPPQP